MRQDIAGGGGVWPAAPLHTQQKEALVVQYKKKEQADAGLRTKTCTPGASVP
jgi:hypothetical protein